MFTYLFGCPGSQLWLAGSLVVAHGLLSCSLPVPQLWHANSQLQHACGIQFPDQGLNPGPLHWELRVLTTVPPGKSLGQLLMNKIWSTGFRVPKSISDLSVGINVTGQNVVFSQNSFSNFLLPLFSLINMASLCQYSFVSLIPDSLF